MRERLSPKSSFESEGEDGVGDFEVFGGREGDKALVGQ